MEESVKMIQLSAADKKFLLIIARKTLQDAFEFIKFDLTKVEIPDHLLMDGASFVTLTKGGRLRGCIGALTAYQPLVQDVCEHALAAAFQDPRFPALSEKEEPDIMIEISYLTPPVVLEYGDTEDLLAKLVPGQDGVILTDGFRRATYLPQVWEQLPEKTEFLDSLCQKMGASRNLWRTKSLKVEIYHAIHFSENEFS
jgi:AmmeMemoRadiSam system protein A